MCVCVSEQVRRRRRRRRRNVYLEGKGCCITLPSSATKSVREQCVSSEWVSLAILPSGVAGIEQSHHRHRHRHSTGTGTCRGTGTCTRTRAGTGTGTGTGTHAGAGAGIAQAAQAQHRSVQIGITWRPGSPALNSLRRASESSATASGSPSVCAGGSLVLPVEQKSKSIVGSILT